MWKTHWASQFVFPHLRFSQAWCFRNMLKGKHSADSAWLGTTELKSKETPTKIYFNLRNPTFWRHTSCCFKDDMAWGMALFLTNCWCYPKSFGFARISKGAATGGCLRLSKTTVSLRLMWWSKSLQCSATALCSLFSGYLKVKLILVGVSLFFNSEICLVLIQADA